MRCIWEGGREGGEGGREGEGEGEGERESSVFLESKGLSVCLKILHIQLGRLVAITL